MLQIILWQENKSFCSMSINIILLLLINGVIKNKLFATPKKSHCTPHRHDIISITWFYISAIEDDDSSSIAIAS